MHGILLLPRCLKLSSPNLRRYLISSMSVIEITGRKRPARLDSNHIKSQVELDKYRKNVEKMALHTSLCVICLGLEKRFSSEELKRLFLVENLTEAEIDSGHLDYNQLELQLQSRNVRIGLDPEAPLS